MRKVSQSSKALVARPALTSRLLISVTTSFSLLTSASKFRKENNAGEFLDCLIRLCADPPEYLHPRDATRYLTLLPLFREFVIQVPDLTGQGLPRTGRRVGECSIQQMRNFGIEAWVDSFLHKNSEHPLMPHYVLDAAQFILFHVEGYYAYPDGDKREHFRLEPMVSYTDSLGPDVFGKRFKAEFTRAACCVYTKGRVPASAHITSPALNFSAYKSGDEFCFRVERCHLSTGFADFLHASCEAEERRFDLMKEFKFWGSLLFHNDAHEVCRPVTVPGDIELRTFVPARWITHAFNRNQLLQPTPWEPPDSDRAGKF